MAEKLPAMVVAKPGQLRDGLRVLLLGIARIGTVSLAEPGLVNLDLTPEQRPALVVLDQGSDSGTLQATLHSIKATWPATLCIVLVEDETERRAGDSGADLVLMKGLLASRLAASIEEALARHIGR